MYPTELILDDGNVHIVDKQENVWPLRRVTAKNLAWLIEGIFSVQRLTYSEDLSKDFDFLRSICVNFFDKDGIQLRYNVFDAYFEYYCAQFSSWYAKKLGLVIHYSKFDCLQRDFCIISYMLFR